MNWIIKFVGYFLLEALIGLIAIISYAKIDAIYGFYVIYLPFTSLVSAIILLLVQLKWNLKSWKFLLASIVIHPIGFLIYFYLANTFNWLWWEKWIKKGLYVIAALDLKLFLTINLTILFNKFINWFKVFFVGPVTLVISCSN